MWENYVSSVNTVILITWHIFHSTENSSVLEDNQPWKRKNNPAQSVQRWEKENITSVALGCHLPEHKAHVTGTEKNQIVKMS